MSDREIYVESSGGYPEEHTNQWDVFDDNDWLASFRKKEDAEEFADQKSLEP